MAEDGDIAALPIAQSLRVLAGRLNDLSTLVATSMELFGKVSDRLDDLEKRVGAMESERARTSG